MRCFRRWCRFLPYVIYKNGLQTHTTPEQAKLQLAATWRQFDKMRDPIEVDMMVMHWYEFMYNIHNQDIWHTAITDIIAPSGRGLPTMYQGFSTLDQDKMEGKSDFMDEFINGKVGHSKY